MATQTLVDSDIEAGRKLVANMDAAGIPVHGAFWFYYPEIERWKLLIVSPDAAKGTRELYVRTLALEPSVDLSVVEFLPPTSPVFAALGSMIRIDGLSEVRLSQNMLNGIYVDDALVYRLAAAA